MASLPCLGVSPTAVARELRDLRHGGAQIGTSLLESPAKSARVRKQDGAKNAAKVRRLATTSATLTPTS
jgi:hypothetical protein